MALKIFRKVNFIYGLFFNIHFGIFLKILCLVISMIIVILFLFTQNYCRNANHKSCICLSEGHANSNIEIEKELQSIKYLEEYKYFVDHHPNFFEPLLDKAYQCLPSLSNIHWVSDTWQLAMDEQRKRYMIYSAIYENRSYAGGPSVYILGMVDGFYPHLEWCSIWFNLTSAPVSLPIVSRAHLDWQAVRDNRLLPFCLQCSIPHLYLHEKPLSVSLISEQCENPTNNLKVFGNGKRSMDEPHLWPVAVCGPALYYYSKDFSVRIVEWLEMLKAINISKVFFYKTDVHPNISKVLDYYEAEGFVEVLSFRYPPYYTDNPIFRRLWTMERRSEMFALENIYFTDCVLRHMDEYKFIMHLDPDEFPVLLKHDTFPEFVTSLIDSVFLEYAAFQLKWRIFYDDVGVTASASHIPSYLHILRHNYWLNNDDHLFSDLLKSIYNMDVVNGVHSHAPCSCLTGSCRTMEVDRDMAYLAHFSRICGEDCQLRSNLVEEKHFLLKFKQIPNKVEVVLRNLNLS